MDDARVTTQLGGKREGRVADGEQDVPERCPGTACRVAVPRLQLEASVDGPHPRDAPDGDARVPVASRAKLVDVAEKLGHRRPVPVARGQDRRRQVAAAQRLLGEAGNEVG